MTKLRINHEEDLEELNKISENVSQIDCLELIGVELRMIPKQILQFKNLKSLSINFTGAKDISKYIGEFEKLEELYIFDNLKEIPNSIINLQSLKILRISGSYEKIPDEIGQLPNLETLHLYGDNFKLIPSTIGNLNQLKEIIINGNNLERLPEEFGELKSLEHFSIGSEKIKNLPNSFSKLINLKTIDFGCDPMKYIKLNFNLIPEYLKEFRLIEYFRGNNFQKKSLDSYLENWGNLKSLSLVDCELTEFPISLKHLKNIERLTLAGNHIKKIPTWISEFKFLEHLDLSSNEIENIPVDELIELEKLNCFVMYKNPISDKKKQEYEKKLDDKIYNKIFD